MPRSQSILGSLVLLLLFSSCATIMNSPTTRINLATSEPAIVVVEKDTLHTDKNGQDIYVTRNASPINVDVIQDGKQKSLDIYSRNSAAYYVNFAGLPAYGIPTLIGLIADNNNPKRYTYPKNILIDTDEFSYLTQNINNLTFYKTILKTRPFSAFNRSNPRVEVALETRKDDNWTTQFGAGYLLSNSNIYVKPLANGTNTNYNLSVEQKYYWAKTAPNGFYASLEGRFMNREQDVYGTFIEPSMLNSTTYIDTFYLVNQDVTLNLKIGYQKIVKHFAFDVFLGGGATYSMIQHLNRKEHKDVLISSGSYWSNSLSMNEGRTWRREIPIGFQIGWAF